MLLLPRSALILVPCPFTETLLNTNDTNLLTPVFMSLTM